jgi:hypothetical protein
VGTKQEPDEQETNEHLFVVIVSPCGHFIAGQEASSANSLVEAVYEEITRRVEQGWLEP